MSSSSSVWSAAAVQALAGVHAERPDPYVIWYELTQWRNAEAVGPAAALPLLVELVPGATVKGFQQALDGVLRGMGPGALGLLPAHCLQQGRSRFLTVRVSREVLAKLAGDPRLSSMIARFDICLPVLPVRPAGPVRAAVPPAPGSRPLQPRAGAAPVLLGVVDSGFNLVGQRLLTRRADGSLRARIGHVLDLREQAMLRDAQAGPEGWVEGRYLCVADIEAQLARHRCGGGVDEASFDAEALGPLDRPRRHITHGAHVLDLAAGRLPLAARLAQTAIEPPSPDPGPDRAADPAHAEIVLVQLPDSGIQDSSGNWLALRLLESLRFVLACAARQKNLQSVVMSISYGHTVGPHNGQSMLEQAFAEALQANEKLQLVLAAGNSFSARGHALVDLARAGHLCWRVLPGGETPSFMQLWLPAEEAARARRLRLSLSAPDGRRIEVGCGEAAVLHGAGEVVQASLIYLAASSRGGAGEAMALLVVEATEVPDGRAPAAPHGDWQLSWTGLKGGRPLPMHAYIARNDQDMGARLRGRQSYFVDAPDGALAYLRAPEDDADHDPANAGPRAGAVLRRRGTLNGIATGARQARLHVAAGFRLDDAGHALYSSAGASGAPEQRGARPTVSQPTDESRALRGVRAQAGLAGAQARLAGTSMAAPQWARHLVNLGGTLPATRPGRVDEDLFGRAGLPEDAG